MRTLDEFVWVYVGCGGTFYAAALYLAVLQRRYGPNACVTVIDPDVIEESDHDRQWSGWQAGRDKTTMAAAMLDRTPFTEIVERFRGEDPVLEQATDGRPVLAIVNVDNDRCRLDVAEWLATRMSPGIMIVSGCERNFGQCYPGVWSEGEPILDWREYHPDVGGNSGAGRRCGLQTIQSNALTGVLVGLCLEDVADWLAHRHENYTREGHLKEFYWSNPVGGSIKMWSSPVCAKRGITL